MKTRVRYTVRIPEPRDHQIHVEMSIDDADEGGVFLEMPVWTPGSYIVREYARHVSGIEARRATGDPVPVEKVAKNVWRVDTKPGKRVDVSYRVFAHELSVRTNHVDADHAFLVPAATFCAVRGRLEEPLEVVFEAPEGWEVRSLLPLAGENSWRARDFDQLADGPFEAGTHEVLRFEVCGVPHRILLCGEGNYDREELLGDTHAICRAAAAMFEDDHPCLEYTFIFHVLEGAGGGLEHLDGSVCGFAPWSFRPRAQYLRQLTLIAHEYFHLWNVKRIRPRELGPFDYNEENYTRLLWVSEGFTTYYMDLLVLRAGLLSPGEYLASLARMIRGYHEVPGRAAEPVEEASFDAWIKLYRPHAHSRNATISYYLKGAMVGLLLDLTIRSETDGEASLDDVMQGLWALYRQRPQEGFTLEELLAMLGEAAGRSLAPEIDAWVRGTEELPFAELLARVGLELAGDDDGEPKPWLGITTKKSDGRLLVSEVLVGTPAAAAGLDAGDELLALDGWRLGDLQERLGEREPGEQVELTVSRLGRLRTFTATLAERPPIDRTLRPLEGAGEREERLFAGWLDAPLADAAKDPGKPPKDPRPRPF